MDVGWTNLRGFNAGWRKCEREAGRRKDNGTARMTYLGVLILLYAYLGLQGEIGMLEWINFGAKATNRQPCGTIYDLVGLSHGLNLVKMIEKGPYRSVWALTLG